MIEITGKELPSFLKRDISQITVQIFKNGKMQAIPFQIDEKEFDPISQSKRWVLDRNFAKGRSSSIIEGNGKLDEEDVILLMQKDLGDKAPPGLIEAAQKIEIQQGNQYAYLLFQPKDKLASSVQYVGFEPSKDSIEGQTYRTRFHPRFPVIQDELVLKNGKQSENLLDRYKVRVLLAIKHFFDVKVEEENLTSQRVGYKIGPIRLIRRVSVYKTLGPIRISPKVESDFLFYAYHVRIPSDLKNPLDGRKHLEPKTDGFAGLDFNHQIYGSKFYSDKNLTPVILNGEMNDEKNRLNGQEINWWMISSDFGSMLLRLDWDPSLKQAGVVSTLYLKDDKTNPNPPESEVGETLLGFKFDYTKVPAGKFKIGVDLIFPPQNFTVEQAPRLIQEAVQPLKSTSRSL